MMLNRQKTHKLMKLMCYKSGEVRFEFVLNKKKMLVGSFAEADITIDDDHISHYHALIVLDEQGATILDLASDNGIYVNNQRVQKSFFSFGDEVKIGNVRFSIEECEIESQSKQAILDHDASIVVLDEAKISELPQDLPPIDGLVVIDDEYCDITFKEESYKPIYKIPIVNTTIETQKYVDFDENDEVLPIKREIDNKAIEVTVMSNGNILSIDYFEIKNKTYFLTSDARKKNAVLLNTLGEEEDDLPFINIKGREFTLYKIPGFQAVNIKDHKEPFGQGDAITFQLDDEFSFIYKTVQVLVRIVDAPPSLRSAPFFGRDRAFKLQATKIFSSIMSIMLLLLLVDTTVEPPKKKVSVIYRKMIKSEKVSNTKSSKDASKKDVDKGIRKKEMPKKELKMAKKANKPTQKPVKKPTPTPPKKVAAKPTPVKKPQKVAKIKAYKFKTTKKFSNLFGATKSLAKTDVKTNTRTVASTTGVGQVKADSDSKLKANTNLDIGTLGSDFAGQYDSSSGAKGLAAKSGIDTTYSDPKTVVLGSMDPDLLRKILREYLPQFRHCYQQELERNEKVRGVVDLHFRIGKNGKVVSSQVRSKKSRFSNAGTNCMVGVLKIIQFPSPKGGGMVDVKQPLNFFSEQDKI